MLSMWTWKTRSKGAYEPCASSGAFENAPEFSGAGKARMRLFSPSVRQEIFLEGCGFGLFFGNFGIDLKGLAAFHSMGCQVPWE